MVVVVVVVVVVVMMSTGPEDWKITGELPVALTRNRSRIRAIWMTDMTLPCQALKSRH